MAKVAFTAGRVAGFKCPADKRQAFLWDATTAGLGLRATPSGKPAYVFQSVYQGNTVRITIGSPKDWSIPDAQAKVRELQRLIDEGKDPRDLKRKAVASHLEKQAAAAAQAVTVAEAWSVYIAARRAKWGDSHHQDHHRYAQPGGVPKKRAKGLTEPGPLHPLMTLALRDLTAERVQAWAAKETAVRPTVTRNAWRLLRAFLSWCSEHPEYAAAVPSTNPAQARKVKEVLGKAGVKQDALQREQLPAWFAAVQGLRNATVAAYLQTMLLTGARPGEVLALRWEDLNVQWRGMTLRDKVEGERTIPLTPYVHHLLAALPRRNEWVFASPKVDDAHLTEPNHAHDRACKVAGIDDLTLHGLRRSFGTLSEWLEVPAGVVAQIQGHKPSATAEKHYRVRPLDLLRLHHERIEAWMLEQAGIAFDRAAESGRLRVVAAA